MQTLPSVKLNDGNSIPTLAYGTGTAWYKSPSDPLSDSLITSIKTAVSLGYTHLDCAEVYNTEPEVGRALTFLSLPRSSLYITTKVNQSIADVPAALKASLSRLGLEHVDLFLIHQPFFAAASSPSAEAEALQRAWAGMEAVQREGLASSIGVSNYLPHHLTATLETATVVPTVNQIEYHPYLQHAPELLDLHRKHGIVTAAYAPLTAVTKAAPGPVDAVYERLADKYAVNAGQVALRWVLDQGMVAVTTSGKEERMKEYLAALEFALTDEEVGEISDEGRKKHFRGFWTHKFDKDDRS
ncbi:MAG: hypothetical protein M1833_001567 [Piccolia ochrophora]|nr:MAG: hypothetical protein M1833_001567 [Piccolia ochrophora]